MHRVESKIHRASSWRIQASTRGTTSRFSDFFFISSSLLFSSLLLMILLFLRHERVHDLLHRFPQVVRATGSYRRYRSRFRSCGSRYAVRNNFLEITFVYMRLLFNFSIFWRAAIAQRSEKSLNDLRSERHRDQKMEANKLDHRRKR